MVNAFVLTTEHHFLLTMSIIQERFNLPEVTNLLVFTGERLAAVSKIHLPANVAPMVIDMENEGKVIEKINNILLHPDLTNLFVFTAYRDLETYLLTKVHKNVKRHLIQDGALMYFDISKPVWWSRLKVTIKIYRNLLKKGILLKRLVLYTKHFAQCSFIDDVWLTYPQLYRQPSYYRRPVIKFNLTLDYVRSCWKFFDGPVPNLHNAIIYIAGRLTRQDQMIKEIQTLKDVCAKKPNLQIFIKLHPNATHLHAELFDRAFGEKVIKNYIPAELYISIATNSEVIGVASAALYFYNPGIKYHSLIRLHQRAGIFPEWMNVRFPDYIDLVP